MEVLGIEIGAYFMSDLMTDLEGSLKRISTKVEIAILRTKFLSAVAFVLDSDRRRVGLVEYLYPAECDLNVSGRHLRILALTLDHLSLYLKHPLTAQARSCLHEFCISMGINNQLSDAIAVPKVDECHSAKFS